MASADDNSKVLSPQAKTLLQGEDGALTRIAGADRYETAVAVSQQVWTSDTTGAVFLASGENFPDALAVAASTGYSGPVLLTNPNYLPEVTRGEIMRLEPCSVIVIGGPAAVSDAVANQAASFASPWLCS